MWFSATSMDSTTVAFRERYSHSLYAAPVSKPKSGSQLLRPEKVATSCRCGCLSFTFSILFRQREHVPRCSVACCVVSVPGFVSQSVSSTVMLQCFRHSSSTFGSGLCSGWKVGNRSLHVVQWNSTMLQSIFWAASI